jgi:solute carrier family 35 protein F1/2
MVDFKKYFTKNNLIGLGLGQFLSLLITATGFASSDLAKKGTVYSNSLNQIQFNFVFLFF